ncbi:hypothetical protein Tco_0727649 [Tanacetum coccineum]|uniref:Uncharacterized protein n=1 Tax=Tanacetum coccineum TaxID=301880 RepID=A0ABQ4YM00_9ASTR
MNSLDAQRERKTRKDHGTRRGRHTTYSSSAFDQPSSSHLNDDDDDGNGEGTSRVRIKQKSQENDQNQTITDTRKGRAQKEPRIL